MSMTIGEVVENKGIGAVLSLDRRRDTSAAGPRASAWLVADGSRGAPRTAPSRPGSRGTLNPLAQPAELLEDGVQPDLDALPIQARKGSRSEGQVVDGRPEAGVESIDVLHGRAV